MGGKTERLILGDVSRSPNVRFAPSADLAGGLFGARFKPVFSPIICR